MSLGVGKDCGHIHPPGKVGLRIKRIFANHGKVGAVSVPQLLYPSERNQAVDAVRPVKHNEVHDRPIKIYEIRHLTN